MALVFLLQFLVDCRFDDETLSSAGFCLSFTRTSDGEVFADDPFRLGVNGVPFSPGWFLYRW